MKKAFFLIVPLMSVVFCRGLVAQGASSKASSAYAEIVFFEGADLQILRSNGKVASDEPIGLKLLPGDQVQTGAKTQVELVLLPRRSRIRLSENTAVTIRDLGEDGSTGLELLYGRLRSKVTKLASGNAPYKVSSQSCVAGVRGTDFGCDVLVSPSGALAPTRVYCFEGSVEIDPSRAAKAASQPEAPAAAYAPAPSDAEAATAPLVISAGAMALVEAATATKAVSIIEKPIEAEVSAYWRANDFTKAEPVGLTSPPIAPVAAAVTLPPPSNAPGIDWTPIRSRLAAKNSAIIGSASFILIGSAFEAASLIIRASDSTQADNLLRVGTIWSAVGLPILVFAFTIDPLKGIAIK